MRNPLPIALLLASLVAITSGCITTKKQIAVSDSLTDPSAKSDAKSMLDMRLEKNLELAAEYPDEPKFVERIASIHWQQGNHIDAIKYLDKARALDPDNPRYDWVEAQIYIQIGNTVDAQRCYQRLVEKLGGDFAGPDYELGWLYYKDQKYKQAEEHFLRCKAINPNLPGVHYSLGMVAYQTQRRDEAIASFEEYLRLGGGPKTSEVTDLLQRMQPELRRVRF